MLPTTSSNKSNIAPLKELSLKSQAKEESALVLFNDHINTFDFVIECLVDYCSHDAIQAEQCAYLVHYSGKCIIKKGTKKELKPIAETLAEKGLTVEIQ